MSDKIIRVEREVQRSAGIRVLEIAGEQPVAVYAAPEVFGRVMFCGCRHWLPKHITPFINALPRNTIVLHGAAGEFDNRVEWVAANPYNPVHEIECGETAFEALYQGKIDRLYAFFCDDREGLSSNVKFTSNKAVDSGIPVTTVSGCRGDWEYVVVKEYLPSSKERP